MTISDLGDPDRLSVVYLVLFSFGIIAALVMAAVSSQSIGSLIVIPVIIMVIGAFNLSWGLVFGGMALFFMIIIGMIIACIIIELRDAKKARMQVKSILAFLDEFIKAAQENLLIFDKDEVAYLELSKKKFMRILLYKIYHVKIENLIEKFGERIREFQWNEDTLNIAYVPQFLKDILGKNK